MKIAFDIDDTLWKIVKDDSPRPDGVGATCACGLHVKQVADDDMIAIAEAFLRAGHEVFVWSAGGIPYATSWLSRFVPHWAGKVGVISKEKEWDMDVCFDDQEVDLARVNVRVRREHADHHN